MADEKKKRRWFTPDRWLSAAVSITLHAVLIIGLVLWTYDVPPEPEIVQLSADIPEGMLEEEPFLEMVDASFMTDATGTSGSVGGLAGVGEGAGDFNPGDFSQASVSDTQTTLARLELSAPVRPLATAPKGIGLTQVVPGLMGSTVDSGGVEGSVDRVVAEILRQMKKGPVLVVWVFDASGSLKELREDVVSRFDKINDQLDELGKMREDLLLNAVVSFGERVQYLTKEPVADVEELKKAVRSLKEDRSGQENVFTAIRESARKYRRFQTQDKRSTMMILVTDEIGDDLRSIDDCVQVLKKSQIPVYVMGPMAPFGRKQIQVTWVDVPTGEAFRIPVDRGPETVLPEHLSLPYWSFGSQYDLFASGFGPFGLSLIARMSGGIYFIFDDGRVASPGFQRDALARYSPDLVTLSDYNKMLADYPLRRTIIDVVRLSEESRGQPQMGGFPVDNLSPQLTEAQKTVATTENVVSRGIDMLSRLEKERESEPSLRWRAHYDLILGRLLATRIRCNEYNWALAQMKVTPLQPKGKNNRWRLVGDQEIRFGKLESNDKAKKERKETQQAKEDADKATALLERVKREHVATPWAAMADKELSIPLGFKWQDYYEKPPEPPKPGEPPKPSKREEAAKRVPKL